MQVTQAEVTSGRTAAVLIVRSADEHDTRSLVEHG